MLRVDHVAAGAQRLGLGDPAARTDFGGAGFAPGVQQQGRRIDRGRGLAERHLDEFGIGEPPDPARHPPGKGSARDVERAAAERDRHRRQ